MIFALIFALEVGEDQRHLVAKIAVTRRTIGVNIPVPAQDHEDTVCSIGQCTPLKCNVLKCFKCYKLTMTLWTSLCLKIRVTKSVYARKITDL